MTTTWLYALVGAVGLGVAAIIYRGLQAPSWMQRRLFVLFALTSTLPVLALLVLQLTMGNRQLEIVDSPGMEASLRSSLELARHSLDQERRQLLDHTGATADMLADDVPLPARAGWSYLLRSSDGSVLRRSGEDHDWKPPSALPAIPQRRHVSSRAFLEAGVATQVGGQPAELWVLAPLDPQIAGHLDAVREGAARFRQLRLYYGKLQRGEAVLSASLLTLGLLVVALLLSRRFARGIGDPVARLALGTRRVAAGDLGHEVRVNANGELAELVGAFNAMTSKLRTSEERLVRSERVAAWQGMARRLAHEIKNPLTPIRLSLHRIRSRVEDPAVSECLDVVLEETEQLRRLADEFAAYARLPTPHFAPMDLRETLASVVELHTVRTDMNVRWNDWIERSEITGDEGLLRQAFANLVKNAVEATGGGGELALSASRTGETLQVTVADSGPGLPGGNGIVFEPRFTTKPAGTGLGLAITRRIIEDHGGTIRGENRPGKGAVFTVELPLRATSPRALQGEA